MSQTPDESEILVEEEFREIAEEEIDGELIREEVDVKVKVEVIEDPDRAVPVRVNRKPVILPRHRMTGLQIKEAAIEQGVDIQPDFHLTLRGKDGEKSRRIENDEHIWVEDHSEFRANDGDDNS